MNAGFADSDMYIKTLKTVPNPLSVGADSDYGFTETQFGHPLILQDSS